MKRYIKSAISPITDEAICDVLEIARTCQDRTYLEQIATTGSDVLKCEVAKNPNLPEDLIRQLYNGHSFKINESIVENPNAPADILATIVDTGASDRVLRKIADHPNTSPDTLANLADTTSWVVRTKVAKRTDTPITALETLAKDWDLSVKRVALRTLQELGRQ